MSGHTATPGPWTTRPDGWQPWPGAIQILGPDGQIIAYTSAGTNEKADAPLLAAAPDLVKALEFYAQEFRYDGPNHRAMPDDPYTPDGQPFLQDVTRDRGAIARAALATLTARKVG